MSICFLFSLLFPTLYTEASSISNTFYIARENEKSFLVINAEEQKKYDVISNLQVTDNNYYYIAHRDNKSFLVINGLEKHNYYGSVAMTDSGYIYYIARENEKSFLVINGEEQKKYDDIFSLKALDTGDIYYFAEENQKEFLVINGEEQKKYDYISFSKVIDAENYYYHAKRDGEEFYINNGLEEKIETLELEEFIPILEGKKEGKYNSSPIVTTEIGSYYIAKKRDKMFLVINNEAQKEYDRIYNSSIKITDAGDIYYTAEKDNKEFLVVNGEEQNKYDDIFLPTVTNSEDIYFFVKENGKEFLVVNGEEQKKYDEIEDYSIEIKPENYYYIAKEDEKQFLVINGEKQKKYNEIYFLTLKITDTGDHYYLAKENDKSFLVINGKEQKKYDKTELYSLEIDNSGNFAYITYESTKEFFVINGKEQKKYDSVYSFSFQEKNISFQDISSSQKEIQYLKNKGFVQGEAVKDEEGVFNFHPQKRISRSEFLKIALFARFSQEEIDAFSPASSPTFVDVSPQVWSFKYIEMAVEKGIIKGHPDGTFRPHSEITFAESSKILTELFSPSSVLSRENTKWWKPFLETFKTQLPELGKHGNYPPHYPITREDMAQYIYWIKH